MSDLINEIDDILKNCFNVGDRVEKALNNCKAEIERLSKPYVPMTDDEWCKYLDDGIPSGLSYSFYKELEADTIARYNEQRGVK